MARSSTLGHPLQGCRVLLFVRFGCSGPPCPLCEALLLQWDVDIAADTLIWRADKFCIPHLERLCGPVGPVSSLLSPGCGGVAWKVWSLPSNTNPCVLRAAKGFSVGRETGGGVKGSTLACHPPLPLPPPSLALARRRGGHPSRCGSGARATRARRDGDVRHAPSSSADGEDPCRGTAAAATPRGI
mmetsp:Transcript_73859/g.196612  ORF Transcript_73859/g.196612 Transcript_73859/m.196612 type:complete len:186 (-) Transcript_73859:345-902(-)